MMMFIILIPCIINTLCNCLVIDSFEYPDNSSLQQNWYTWFNSPSQPYVHEEYGIGFDFLNYKSYLSRRFDPPLNLSCNCVFAIDMIIVGAEQLNLTDIYSFGIYTVSIDNGQSKYLFHYKHQANNLQKGKNTYYFNKQQFSADVNWENVTEIDFLLSNDLDDGITRTIYLKNFVMIQPKVAVIGIDNIVKDLHLNGIPAVHDNDFNYNLFNGIDFLFLSNTLDLNQDRINLVLDYVNEGGKLFYIVQYDGVDDIQSEILDLFGIELDGFEKKVYFQKFKYVGEMLIDDFIDESYYGDEYYLWSNKVLKNDSNSQIMGYFSNIYNKSNIYKYPSHIVNKDKGVFLHFAQLSEKADSFIYQIHLLLMLDVFDKSIWENAYNCQIKRIDNFNDYPLNSLEEFISLFVDSKSQGKKLRDDYDSILEKVNENNYREASFDAIRLYKRMEIIFTKSQYPRDLDIIKGVWIIPKFIYQEDWDNRCRVLKKLGFSNIYLAAVSQYYNFTSYYYDKENYGDQIRYCINSAKKYNIKCHLWVTPFSVRRWPNNVKSEIDVQKSQTNVTLDVNNQHMCPSANGNLGQNIDLSRNALLYLLERYPDLSGIHLDYIRFLNGGCYCNHCRNKFKNEYNISNLSWPEDVLEDGELFNEYRRFRSDIITNYVNNFHDDILQMEEYSHMYYSAAVFSPALNLNVGANYSSNNWKIDEVSPMIYYRNFDIFNHWIKAVKNLNVVPKVTIGAVVYRNDVPRLLRQVNQAISLGFDGFTLFALESRLEGYMFKIFEEAFADDDEGGNEEDNTIIIIISIILGCASFLLLIFFLIVVLYCLVNKKKTKKYDDIPLFDIKSK